MSVGLDSIRLIPVAGGAGSLARAFGHQAGYVGIVADNLGRKMIPALGQLAAGASIVNDAIKTGIAISKCL